MFNSRSRHAFVAQLVDQPRGMRQAACSTHAEGTSIGIQGSGIRSQPSENSDGSPRGPAPFPSLILIPDS